MFKEIKDRIKDMTGESKRETEREASIEALQEHLRRIGLSATVESREPKNLSMRTGGTIIGSIKIENRNIDLIEMEWHVQGGARRAHGGTTPRRDLFRCNYVVQARVEGLEDKLEAEAKPVTKGFLSKEIVDFKWEGKELANTLNGDADLKNMLYSPDKLAMKNKGLIQLPAIEIKPYEKDQCIRISQKWYYYSPSSAFPTIETFEACDRIAQHVRGIANVRP